MAISSETVELYLQRKPALKQIDMPVCGDAEIFLVVSLLQMLRGVEPVLKQEQVYISLKRRRYYTNTTLLRKQIGLPTNLILTGELAGFIAGQKKSQALRPILSHPIMSSTELTKMCIMQPPIVSNLLKHEEVSAPRLHILNFIHYALQQLCIVHDFETMTRNANTFQTLVNQQHIFY